MRSQLIHDAMVHVPNRYQLARLLSMAARDFQRPGTRIEDTLNELLIRFRSGNPIAQSNDGSHQPGGLSVHRRRVHSSWDSGALVELQRILGDQTEGVIAAGELSSSDSLDSPFVH